jgi:putative transposase
MVRPLSMDLRERAVARIAAGESVRKVALALSVAPSSVVKWTQRLRATGSVAPGKIGGHVPPKIAGTHRAWLVARTAAAFTLRGLVAELAGRGLRVDYRTVWTFIRREGLSFKKNRAGSKTIPASPASAGGGRPSRAALIRGGWSSLMKPGPRRIWGRCAGGLRAASACRDRFPTDTGRP